jgi:hypothetical protein
MKIYKIGNIYAVLTRTKQGGFLDYARTRAEAIEKGLQHIKDTMYHRGNLLVL